MHAYAKLESKSWKTSKKNFFRNEKTYNEIFLYNSFKKLSQILANLNEKKVLKCRLWIF